MVPAVPTTPISCPFDQRDPRRLTAVGNATAIAELMALGWAASERAAHRSQRWAAPISAYLVGVAFAPLPRADRLDRIRALAAQLDVEAR